MKPKIWRRDWSRRAVSLLLALALLASLLPGTVTAASGEDITAAKKKPTWPTMSGSQNIRPSRRWRYML